MPEIAEGAGGGNIEVGSLVIRVRAAAENVSQVMTAVTGTVNKAGEVGAAAAKGAGAAAQRLRELAAAANVSSEALSKVGGNTANIDKYTVRMERLTNKYDEQKGKVFALQERLDAMAQTYAEIQRATGGSVDFKLEDIAPDLTVKYDMELRKLDELRNQLRLTEQERASAAATDAARMEKAITQQESFNQKLADKTATADAKLGFDTAAMAIRGVSSAAGGAVGNLGYLASEVIFLKKAMSTAASSAMAMSAAISGGVMIAVTLLSLGINALKEAEEKRKQAFEEGVNNLRKYSEEVTVLERNLSVLEDQTSTTENLKAARSDLASTFPSLVVGWTDEGDAILATMDVMEKYLGVVKEGNRLAREQIVANGKGNEEFANLQNQIEMLEKRIKYQKELRSGLQPSPYILPFETFAFSLDPEIGGFDRSIIEESKVSIEELQEQMDKLKVKQQEFIPETDQYFVALIQSGIRVKDTVTGIIRGYDDLDKKQQAVANNYRLQFAEKIRTNKISPETVIAKLNELLSDTSAVEEYYSGLTFLNDAAEENTKKIQSQISVLNNLNDAYNTLAGSKQLDLDQINALIREYPQVAEYISKTGDMTLNNGKIIAEVHEIKRQAFISEQKMALEALKTEKETTEKTIASLNDRTQAYAELGIAFSFAAISKGLDLPNRPLETIEAEIARINALIKTAESSAGKVGGAGLADAGKSAFEKEMDRLEKKKKYNDFTYAEEIEWLERVKKQYKLNADERSELDYRIDTLKREQAQREYDLQVYYGKLTLEQQAAHIKKQVAQ